ncbi:helix-turn-helix transcriptional regulator [Streptomyces sp. HU2014]|uniref:DNA-binding protein n=1 Tax=Streptomyces albireticuli TaxID=1940 RepID=A0A1Z2KV07_9ACTN|nr:MULTISPECIES: helix-turn-helix transcriptional regulator [Streptomyces]ARZ65781.1 DNA-binding protein [Streptomyces albireticuli]UQI45977.1 helix-turn-helix transcriptional regulator [Streptomyces sp. HU2014]UQI46071.1 helix-turn-helix transcriptional regulator [Streptomyces sp. HU2014]
MAADLVRARRVQLGMSQAELAARAGTGQAFVSRVESGKTIPTLPVLQRLATALECDVALDFLPHR